MFPPTVGRAAHFLKNLTHNKNHLERRKEGREGRREKRRVEKKERKERKRSKKKNGLYNRIIRKNCLNLLCCLGYYYYDSICMIIYHTSVV